MSDTARPAPATPPGDDASPDGAGFWIAVGVGWALIGFGLARLVLDGGFGHVLDVGTWVVGLDLVHDLAFAPVATVVAIGVLVVVPRGWRAPLLAGLGTTVVVLLLAWPLLGGYGRTDNPTELPLDYPTAVATVLGVVWGLVALWYVVLGLRGLRHRRAGLSAGPGDGPDSSP